MASADFKDLTKGTAVDKVLRDKACNNAKDPKYDGYQRGLASMVYKFINKDITGSDTKLIPQNEQIAEELQLKIKNFIKKKSVLNI